MLRILLLSCSISLLPGCLPAYVAPSSAPTAEFFAFSEHNSSSTNTRMISLLAFNNEECSSNPQGTMVGHSPPFGNDPILTTPSNRIVANEKFVFTARYGDARFAQNRECYQTAAFSPEANHRYKAKITIDDDVTKCSIGIFDVTTEQERQIDFSMPKYVCFPAGKTNILNGTPLWTNWSVTVTTVPVR